MDPPRLNSSFGEASRTRERRQSCSQQSDDSHTAAEFIDSQLQLEADAREALPYNFKDCTKPLGPLRQSVFACLTCLSPQSNPSDSYTPAGVCYSCSIQCHGEHTLVEIFNKRNFTCDCGTTRFPSISPCTLRLNAETNTQGNVHSEAPDLNNKYNQNFRNRFCGCECDYDPMMQKGTMFQCLGLGTVEDGGCGEDWWHPGCVVGLRPEWYEAASRKATLTKPDNNGLLTSIAEVAEAVVDVPNDNANGTVDEARREWEGGHEEEDDDLPLPPGFPHEDDFEGFICYKCVESYPWIKRFAGAPGFLPAVFKKSGAPSPEVGVQAKVEEVLNVLPSHLKKRKAEDESSNASSSSKRLKESDSISAEASIDTMEASKVDIKDESTCKVAKLPAAPEGKLSMFFKSDFRDHLCRCPDCFPNLAKHPQLLDEEEIYEPPLSEAGDEGGSTVGSGSIYDRGESALRNVDRVRAIEGVMAYNHLKEKLTPFFQQFADSGKAISAEDIKAHFAKMRGDELAIKEAGESAKESGDHRREQSGY